MTKFSSKSSPNTPNGKEERSQLGVSFLLALIAHTALFAMLFISIQWKAQPMGPVYAELWNAPGDTVPAEAPKPEPAPEPEPEPEPAPQPKPEPTPEPAPPPPPVASTDLARRTNLLDNPDIVLEKLDREVQKKKEEEQKLLEAKRKEEEARQAEERRKAELAKQAELKRLEEQKKLEEKKRKEAEELKRQAAEREKKIAEEKKRREEELRKKREAQAELARKKEAEKKAAAEAAQRRREMLSRLAGQSSSAVSQGGGSMTTMQRAQYINRIVSCVRPNITFNPPASAKSGQFVASFEVRLLRNGMQSGRPKLMKTSGLTAFDAAVERAILKCDPFPKPDTGDVPRSIILNFDPVDPTTR